MTEHRPTWVCRRDDDVLGLQTCMRYSSMRVGGPALVMIQQGSLNQLRMPQCFTSIFSCSFSLDGPELSLAIVACAPSGRHTVVTADECNSAKSARCAMVLDALDARISYKTTQAASTLYDGPWHAAWSPNGRFLILYMYMRSRTRAGPIRMIHVIDTASWKEVACLRLPFNAANIWWAADGCSMLASSGPGPGHAGRNMIRIIDLCY